MLPGRPQAAREDAMSRRLFLLLAVPILVAFGASARADVAPFDAKAFADAQRAGKGVIIHVHAPW